jgi:predicted alpha-1,6-mannanase (GH76 family)
MTGTTSVPLWNQRADLAQASLDRYFAAPEPQLLHNRYPFHPGDDDVFNFWWLAHVLDVRLDAYLRTGDPAWLIEARRVFDNILARNGGSPFNDYFDDMLWLGLATLRLADATGSDSLRSVSVRIWEHVRSHGWNEHQGGGIAWRVAQPYYKNTPANGPFIILSARLGELAWARRTMEWLEKTLVCPDGFVHDGINRASDGRIDEHWRFTYNQGLYIGACVELARATGDDSYLRRAARTARTAVSELMSGGVFADEGEGGDEGLFKGIFYRYAKLLVDATGDPGLRSVLLGSTTILWEQGFAEGETLAGNDWRKPPAGQVAYSTQLSAIMATEACAALAARS